MFLFHEFMGSRFFTISHSDCKDYLCFNLCLIMQISIYCMPRTSLGALHVFTVIRRTQKLYDFHPSFTNKETSLDKVKQLAPVLQWEAAARVTAMWWHRDKLDSLMAGPRLSAIRQKCHHQPSLSHAPQHRGCWRPRGLLPWWVAVRSFQLLK